MKSREKQLNKDSVTATQHFLTHFKCSYVFALIQTFLLPVMSSVYNKTDNWMLNRE